MISVRRLGGPVRRLLAPIGRFFGRIGRGFRRFGRALGRLVRRMFPRRVLLVLTGLLILGAIVTGAVLTVPRNQSATPEVSPTSAPTATSDAAESSEDEEPSDDETTTTPFDPDPEPAGGLPSDLLPNVLEDECLLTAPEFESLTGETGLRAENTELAGGDGRRSCFYGPTDPESEDPPAGRVDVYSSASLPPADLVSRIAENSGGRALPGVASGAVLVTGDEGSLEFVMATPSLLVVLTLLPDTAGTVPADDAWSTAGAAMLTRLPT